MYPVGSRIAGVYHGAEFSGVVHAKDTCEEYVWLSIALDEPITVYGHTRPMLGAALSYTTRAPISSHVTIHTNP